MRTPAIFDPPFDPTDRYAGLDRWFRVEIAPGSEQMKVREYARDSRVDVVELTGAGTGSF